MGRLRTCAALALAAACAACGETAGSASPQAFRDVTDASGVDFVHRADLLGDFALPEVMGSGCAVFDADGDGRLDLFLVDAGRTRGDGATDRLFLRTAGGRYEDATAASGIADRGYGMGTAVGDVDNDGDLDLFVANWGPDALWRNEGGGRFRDATREAGIAGNAWSSSAAFLDFDLDGFLDLWVVHYVDVDPSKPCTGADSRREYCSPNAFAPVADTLWRNRGDGTFEDVSARAGIAGAPAAGLGLVVLDVDDDGRPDVYVANDACPNQMWRNCGDGTFEDIGVQLGCALSAHGVPRAGMGVAAGDVDGDGTDDLVVTNLVGETFSLYLRRDRAAYTEGSLRTGLAQATRDRTGFGVALADLDLDGDLDVVLANGRVRRGPVPEGSRLPAEWAPYGDRNQLLVNDGAGKLADLASSAVAWSRTAESSRALAAADLDDDGDLDLVVTSCRGRARILESVAPRAGRWLSVRAVDPKLRRDAYGARVVVRAGGRAFARTVGAATSYLTSVPAAVHFGLGPADAVEGIEVTWPGGARETFPGGAADRAVRVERGSGAR